MSPTAALRLVDNDASFYNPPVDPSNRKSMESLDPSTLLPGASRVLFNGQRRLYFDHSTHLEINMPRAAWLDVLKTCRVPPTAIELLHENNGGCFQHVSYCNDNPRSPCEAAFSDSTPCAYHVCFKLCQWVFEHFIYARYDFHTCTTFIMVEGTTAERQVQRLLVQFHEQGPRDTDLFAILHALACVWAEEVEQEAGGSTSTRRSSSR
ncbi:Uu.00g051500.m01.CDS01 [Anthostomella pinea]|uniref:Uu.00g051500.m01.CDS01 n=1 Tax=Anthostomella pinea TaxID=933095 RepID=A0AAI8VSV7_9PEZI|nr:Uu.00g051500.m01.CDS01 [Anthostomella pinea]